MTKKWSIDKANNWYKEKGWVIGFNFLPSYAINSTEMWQNETFNIDAIEKELRFAKKLGYNSCRIFLQFIVWKNEKKSFNKNFKLFIDLCGDIGLSVMPILFDDCAFSKKEPYLGKQNEPIKNIHNSGWTPSPGFYHADNEKYLQELEQYIKETISQYRNNETVLIWDLYNEPGNSDRKEKCNALLEYVFKWARECSPIQPLTSGVWEWKPYDLRCVELSDIISFHDYTEISSTKNRVNNFICENRPIFCTEWLHRNNNNSFDTHLKYYKKLNISIYQWGFVNGKTQTHLDWSTENNHNNQPNGKWQHDLLHTNLEPYCKKELALLSKIIDGQL